MTEIEASAAAPTASAVYALRPGRHVAWMKASSTVSSW